MNLTNHLINQISKANLITDPIDHLVIDNLLPTEFAKILSDGFGDYNGEHWHRYSNTIEEKKTCNQWNLFPESIYQYFLAICSHSVNHTISSKFSIQVEPDFGLHGGGLHIHSHMGNLNPHLDYSIHPKTGQERRLNAIYFLTDDHQDGDGGHFGLWGNEDSSSPGELLKEYAPIFNRLIIFNTSQNSWHGLSRIYAPSKVKFRKSLATYYVSEPRKTALNHTRALFAPRKEQIGDEDIKELIKIRSSEKHHSKAYITDI